ncbi:hypothetical protein D1007_32031 [Hordeum vulgare]|nr:hypothetical protein D1007_32031 [Hordeum vulgare]
MLEDKRPVMEETRKCKMTSNRKSKNQKTHPWQPALAKTNYQPQQARTHAPCPRYQPQQYANPRPAYHNPNNNTGGKSNNFGQVMCFGCGQLGHISKQCPNKKPDASRPMRQTKDKTVECH